jgi:hypothetical protein
VKVLVLGTATVALVQSTTTLLSRATEPVWMLLWGVALLVLASGARSLFLRRDSARAPALTPSVAPQPRRTVVASVVPATNWREALVAKLMADRAHVS